MNRIRNYIKRTGYHAAVVWRKGTQNFLTAHVEGEACLCGAIGQRARLLTERLVVQAHPGTKGCLYYPAAQGQCMLLELSGALSLGLA